MNKKVFFVGGAYMGCNYVRLLLPMIENGWKGSYEGISKSTLKSPELVKKEMLEADIIVFHRANTNWHHRVAMILKQQGKKIVFDNDDTFQLTESHPFFGTDEKGFKENKRRMNNVINNFIINSDLITTSTEFLAKEYRELNKNVAVLPNCVNPDDWDEPLRNKGDKVRIGLVGSVAYNHDFEHIKKTIRKLDNMDNVQIVLFGLWKDVKRKDNKLVDKVLGKEYRFWDSIKNKEHIQWCPTEDYFNTLNNTRLDIMIIPRRHNHFNQCKSNVKFLEAGMLEIPVIAQGFPNKTSPYDDDIDGENGILVTDNTKWEEEIISLVNNKGKRLLMGSTAHQYVLDNYNIADHYTKWANVYNKLF